MIVLLCQASELDGHNSSLLSDRNLCSLNYMVISCRVEHILSILPLLQEQRWDDSGPLSELDGHNWFLLSDRNLCPLVFSCGVEHMLSVLPPFPFLLSIEH